jgi:chromosome segregation ATPase
MRLRLVEQELEAVVQERDELRARLAGAQELVEAAEAARVGVEASLRRERRAADTAGETRDEVARARTAAERDRDIALAQRDEAVQDREAAVRTRTRMELAGAEAAERQAAAEAALVRAQAERDDAQAQRDEVLLAYRALQRHVHSERAETDRAERPAADTDLDAPLGVRTMPAARTIMAELQRPAPSSKFVVSKFDVWVVRVLGSVAAGCFILLLVAILRVFI